MTRKLIVSLLAATALLGLFVSGSWALGVGDQAPDWTLTNVRTGESVSLADYRGKYVLLDFWATWCGPCRMAMEHELNPMFQMLGDRDDWQLISIGIASGGETPAGQRQFADSNSYNWQFVHDSTDEVADAYEVTGIPTMVMINPEGVIEAMDYHGVGLQLARRLDPSITALVPSRSDLAGQGTPLALGQQVQGTVPVQGEVVYTLTAPSAGSLLLATSGEMDTILQVFGDNGSIIAENDDVSPGVYTSEIRMDVEAGQPLHIVVSGYGGSGGDFGITVNPVM